MRRSIAICGFGVFSGFVAPFCQAQSTAATTTPDYSPSVEVQHEDLATARSHFKAKILRKGPPPTEWDDLVTPDGAVEVVYASGDLKLKAWMSRINDKAKHQAVLFLHPGFDLWPDVWAFTKPLR